MVISQLSGGELSVAMARRQTRNDKSAETRATSRGKKHRRIEHEFKAYNTRFDRIVDSAMDAIITIDDTYRILVFNKAAESMFCCSAEEAIGQTLDRFIPERFRMVQRRHLEALIKAREIPHRSSRLNRLVGLRTNGEEFPFEGAISQVNIGRGKLLTIILRDLTDRKVAELLARQKEEWFRTFLDHAPNLAFVKASDGRYLYVNKRFEEVFQFDRRMVLGKKDVDLFPKEQAEQFQANDRQVLESGQAIEFEETAMYSDGPHTSIVVKFPLRDMTNQIYAIGGIVTDITDRIRAEAELNRSQEQLRRHQELLQDLASKLLVAQEKERQRIARELHDDYGQRLAAVVLDIASLEQQPPVLPELVPKLLEPIREQVEQLADDVHNAAYNLHPSLLAHAGLRPAVEDHIQKVSARTGLRVDFRASNVPCSLSLDESTCLFRILQESLQNVVKHANATEVAVKLSGSSKGFGVSVRDNGKGFDVSDRSSHKTGMGLVSMQERMRLLNGFLRVHSLPADGTKVCAWIPHEKDKA